MKKMDWLLFMLVLPVICFAEEALEVPQVVTDSVSSLVQNAVPQTIVLSGIFVTIVQALKKVLGQFKIDVSGIKSQALAIAVAVIYVLLNLNVWDDGNLSQKDIVLIIEAVVSTVGGIFGYKLLWRKTDQTFPDASSEEPSKDKE